MATLSLDNVRCLYGANAALDGITLKIDSGELLVCVGPSGCGKSTLLRAIAGLQPISGGEIAIGGQTVSHLPPAQRDIAMVFQSYALYPHMSVRENMGIGLRVRGIAKDEYNRRVEEAAATLRISDLLERRPQQLSGGQMQRVAIGRAIVRQPKVFLFDEPLSNLDTALRAQMRSEIAALHRSLAATMVYVTHDQSEAMALADRIAVIDAGRLRQVAAPADLYQRPVDVFVAGAIGEHGINLLPLVPACESDTSGVIEAPGLGHFRIGAGGGEVSGMQLGVRPEHLRLGADGQFRLTGQIEHIEFLGTRAMALLRCDACGEVRALIPAKGNPRPGEACQLSFDRADCLLFDGQGGALDQNTD